MKIFELVAGIFAPAAELVDDIHTSTEEKLEQKRRLIEVQAKVIDQVVEYERDALTARANIVNSEAQSEHFITATWRPITMLTFLAVIVVDYGSYMLGGKTLLFTPALAGEMWSLLQIGIGGYVVARGGEKIVKQVMDAKVTK